MCRPYVAMQVREEESPAAAAVLRQGQFQGQLVTCPGARKYCVGFVCRQPFSSGILALDVATSRCALLHCATGDRAETDYERCVVDVCC